MDLSEYLAEIDNVGGLRKLEGADWNLEWGAMREMVGEKDGPALLFDNIKDYPQGFRVLTNFLNNSKHVNKAFGFPAEQSTLDLVRAVKDKFTRMKLVDPEEVSTGPVCENVQEGEDIDLLKFPAPWWHEY